MLTQHTLNTIQSAPDEQGYFKTTEVALYFACGGYLAEANELLATLWKQPRPSERVTWLADIAFTYLWNAAGSHPDNIPFELQNIDTLEKDMRDYRAMTTMAHKAIAAESAAAKGDLNAAIQLAKACVVEDQSKSAWYYLSILATGRHLAPLLLQKIIASELELTDTIVKEYLAEILTTLNNRMSKGRTLVYGDLSWKELLERISKEAIRVQRAGAFEPQVYQSGWIGYPGATQTAIEAAETRLGVTLPQDYKDFLAVTNGIRPFSTVDPTLLPVEQIDYLKNVYDSWTLDLILDYAHNEDTDEIYQEKINNTIIISKYNEEQELWLVPQNKEKTLWETWFYAFWVPGMEPYPSFRFKIEQDLETISRFNSKDSPST